MKSEPLVGKVPPAIDHELGTEESSDRPSRDQCGHQGVGKGRQPCLGPPATLENEPNNESQRDAAKTREPSLPDGDPPSRVALVVTPVGGDIARPSPEEATDQEPHRVLGEGLDAKA